jgi:phosphohistidine phosphatase
MRPSKSLFSKEPTGMSATLYFFRHGEAYQIGEKGIKTDEERPLTPKGSQVTTEVCAGLSALGITGTTLWHSPLVRAVETAEIIREELGIPNIKVQPGLAYENHAEPLFLSLTTLPPEAKIFLVGHQPQLGDWICRLITGCKEGDLALSKSGVARVDLKFEDSGRKPSVGPFGELRWMLTAKQLRRMR